MSKKKDAITELKSHYKAWTDDNNIRMTRKFGWNDITDSYYGKLPADWPFTSKTTDPRIRTAIIEKNARLCNGKLRGRVVPRESGDELGAKLQNALLDFQWDSANDGGSMTTKVGICDLDTRLYNSKFALVKWKYVLDEDGKCLFNGNEMTPLDIRDCGMDYAAMHIRGAKWFQHREWVYIEDLENESDVSGSPLFENIGKIKYAMRQGKQEGTNNTERRNEYTSRVKQLRGLEDRLGTDMAFPMLEIVTEYRSDRWITFSPKYDQILRDIPNPYDHKKIPVAQLRYYPLQDDPLGESEVETVIPLWRAIQATVCGFMDEMMLKIRPPLKIVEGQARIETIVYGPEAQWLVNRQDAVEEMGSTNTTLQYFQTSYSSLVAAFNSAMGMLSQGTSGVDPFNPQKTATEVNASVSQQNARDQKNQQDLTEFIKDIIEMWIANNRQFLFADPSQKDYVLQIVGQENFEYFKKAGMADTYLPNEAAKMIGDLVTQLPEVSDTDIQLMFQSGQMPKYPILTNPGEKDPTKMNLTTKMEISKMGDIAKIHVVPEDISGTFDYVPDVKSLSISASEEMARTRTNLIQLITSNPTVVQLLAQDGYQAKVRDLLIADLEDKGLRDATRFFEKIENGQTNQGQQNQPSNPAMGGLQPNSQLGGLPQVPQTVPGGTDSQQMAGPGAGGPTGPAPLPNGGGIPQGLQ